MSNAGNLVLTESQAACLIALRHREDSQATVAIEAKLAFAKTTTALRALARLGLAEHNKKWHATSRGKACRFETVPDRVRRNTGLPGPNGRRLLELLDRPMGGREIAEKLQITPQKVRELLINLHALGCVNFGDPPDRALRIVAAYASIRELSETEFCRLVDDLTIASASMPPSTDNPPTA